MMLNIDGTLLVELSLGILSNGFTSERVETQERTRVSWGVPGRPNAQSNYLLGIALASSERYRVLHRHSRKRPSKATRGRPFDQ